MATAGLSESQVEEASARASVDSNDRKILVDHVRHKTFEERVAPLRSGSEEVRILDISVIDEGGVEIDTVEFNCKCCIRVLFKAYARVPEGAALTLGITDSTGNQIVHFNSATHGVFLGGTPVNQPQLIEFVFENKRCPGEYGLIAGIGVLSPHPAHHGKCL